MNEINQNLLSDLEIDQKVIPALDYTITIHGKRTFKNMFNNLIYDCEQLEQKKQIIHIILSNPATVNKITKQLKIITKYQHDIEWFFSTLSDEFQNMYFKTEHFNTKELLSTKNFFAIYVPSLLMCVYLVIYCFLRYYGIKIGIKQYITQIYESYKSYIRLVLTFFTTNVNMVSFCTNFLALLYLVFQLYSVYNSVDTSINHYNCCTKFRVKIDRIRKFVLCCEKIHKLDIAIPKPNSKMLKNIKRKFDDASLGHCLLLKRDHNELKIDFDIMTDYIGYVDAYISMSKLVTKCGFAFPSFVARDVPFVYAEGMWLPYTPKGDSVTNDCFLGEPQNIILTGPNTSGKSTYLRSVMLTVLLAQTLGLTCCSKFVCTPFFSLFTYLNIPNVAKNKESLFESELLRCIEFCNIIKTIPKNRFIFTVMDELFTGTNPKEGISCSYAVCEYVGGFTNCLNIITTHFIELTALETSLPNTFKNMKFTVVEDNGKFDRSYKIQNGKSDQNIAIKLLKEKGYDDYVIERALIKLEQLL